MPGGHPAVGRVAKLLADHGEFAAPLAAFVDLLAEAAEKFPEGGRGERQADVAADAGAAAEPAGQAHPRVVEATQPSAYDPLRAHELVAGKVSPDFPQPAGRGIPIDRQGWIPVLGRSAAGVPHFWRDIGADGDDAAVLADLVAAMKPRWARHVARAEAMGELAGDQASVQIVLLDTPVSPGTAEFIIADHIAREHEVLFGVRIDGESMQPEIRHGDVVILSPECPAEQGKPSVVQLADQIGVTCKLFRTEGDRVHLIPINESFSPASYRGDQLLWALKVIARVRPM